MFGIWLTAEHSGTTADARCGAVARFRTIARCAVNLYQHCIVNVRAKSIFHGFGINAMPVSSQLDSITDARRNVLHENLSRGRATATKGVRHNQFRISVDSSPRPNVACALLHLFKSDILLFRVDERPNFVALNAPHVEITDMGLMIIGAGATQVTQESQYRMLADAQHPACCVDRISFHQRTDDLALLAHRKVIRNVHRSIPYRSRISQEANALDFRNRSRIIRHGEEEEKPVCCSAGAQRWTQGWSRTCGQYDSAGAQRERQECCGGTLGKGQRASNCERSTRKRGRF